MIMWWYMVGLLRQIQSQYLESSGGEGGGGKSVEERMLAFQRECEDRARREVALGGEGGGTPTAFQVETDRGNRRLMQPYWVVGAELGRLREVEMAKVRAEEAAQHRRELEAMREQLRAEYNDKLDK